MPVAVAEIGDPGPQECASLERTGISDPGYSKSQTGCLHHVAFVVAAVYDRRRSQSAATEIVRLCQADVVDQACLAEENSQ